LPSTAAASPWLRPRGHDRLVQLQRRLRSAPIHAGRIAPAGIAARSRVSATVHVRRLALAGIIGAPAPAARLISATAGVSAAVHVRRFTRLRREPTPAAPGAVHRARPGGLICGLLRVGFAIATRASVGRQVRRRGCALRAASAVSAVKPTEAVAIAALIVVGCAGITSLARFVAALPVRRKIGG